ncbi:addiction module protein [Desulfonatronovibrio magnus]|uniref:addiction module protein n=1 Tax=Desulfonatronovibrio magnus TaxID=698827 RepID=UPI0005EBE567|nr:addiction module protein [Desulfonatronovibrio magnus]
MQQTQIAQEIKKLEPAHRLSLVQEIWASIAIDKAQIPFPDWQKDELKFRYEQYKNGKMSLIDWCNVHQKLRDKVK